MPGSGYLLVLYSEGYFVFIKKDFTFEIDGKSYTFGLQSSEKILFAAGGDGGIIIVTNEDAYYYPVIAPQEPSVRHSLHLQDAGINNDDIVRVEVSRLPAIYLANNSVYVYKEAKKFTIEVTGDDEETTQETISIYPGCA